MQLLDPSSGFIPSQHQPALIVEFARDRDVPDAVLFKQTGLSSRQILDCPGNVTAQQTLQLIGNTVKHLQSPDSNFLLGQMALPGHYGAISQALMHAPNLEEALRLLVRFQAQLSPLLVPHLQVMGEHTVLYWTDAFGMPALRTCLVDMSMAATQAMCRWLSGKPLNWTYCFNRTHPRGTEQHEVHLGRQLRFDCLVDGVLIPSDTLRTPWPRGSEAGLAVAMQALAGQSRQVCLLSALYDHLLNNIQAAPTLEDTATHFGVSPATFKRQLGRLGTHFQAELDQVRTHVTLRLFHEGARDNEAVARYLGFHDAANFRRSFKRWTGLTPRLLRAGLAPAIG